MCLDHITHDERELGRREQKMKEIRNDVVDNRVGQGEEPPVVDELDADLNTAEVKVYVENCKHFDVPNKLLRLMGSHDYFYDGWAVNGAIGDNRAIFEFKIAEAFTGY